MLRQLPFEEVAQKAFAQRSTAALIAENLAQRRRVGLYHLAIIKTGIGPCAHDACDTRLSATERPGSSHQVRKHLYLHLLRQRGQIGSQ